MITIYEKEKLDEFLANESPWYHYGNPIWMREGEYDHPAYYIFAGEVQSDSTALFRAMIIDRKTWDVYRIAFNSNVGTPENKEWILDVFISIYTEGLSQSKRNYRKRVRSCMNALHELAGITLPE